MPKKAYLAEHLSSEELKDRYRSSQDSVRDEKKLGIKGDGIT